MTMKSNAEHLQVIFGLENAHTAATGEVRRAAIESLRQLVIRNEELLARLESRPEPEWLQKIREDLLPQFRVHLETKSGPWVQSKESVFLGSIDKGDDALFLTAFAKLKAGKFPNAELHQWRMVEAVENGNCS